MTEIFCVIIGAAAAFYFMNRKKPEEKTKENFMEEKTDESDMLSPMLLRNGYGVTKDKQPTFAEQWVNIINYCGESQLEGEYEEDKRDDAGKYLGRVS